MEKTSVSCIIQWTANWFYFVFVKSKKQMYVEKYSNKLVQLLFQMFEIEQLLVLVLSTCIVSYIVEHQSHR